MFRLIEIYIRQGLPCLFHLITGFYCPGWARHQSSEVSAARTDLKSIRYHRCLLCCGVILAELLRMRTAVT